VVDKLFVRALKEINLEPHVQQDECSKKGEKKIYTSKRAKNGMHLMLIVTCTSHLMHWL